MYNEKEYIKNLKKDLKYFKRIVEMKEKYPEYSTLRNQTFVIGFVLGLVVAYTCYVLVV